ncbi:MAG: RecB family exonuclease [Planctomycetota bacterium]
MRGHTTREVHLSHSQVSEFTMCPRRYHLHRRLGLEPEFAPSALVFGSSVHEALAFYHRMRLRGEEPELEAMLEVFRRRFGQEKLPVRYRPDESAESLEAKAAGMLSAYLESPHLLGEVIGVEEPFRLTLHPELPPIHGRLDLVERENEGGLVITDFKTSSSRRKPDDYDQLALYREAVRSFGDPSDGGVRARYLALLKTKEPDIVLFCPHESELDTARLITGYREVWHAIRSGSRYPRTGWWCGGCRWQRHCDRG